MAGRPNIVSKPTVATAGEAHVVAQPVGAAPAAANSSSNSSEPQTYEIIAPQGAPIAIDATSFTRPKVPVAQPIALNGAGSNKGKDVMVYDITISLVDKKAEKAEQPGSRQQRKKHHRHSKHHQHNKEIKELIDHFANQ